MKRDQIDYDLLMNIVKIIGILLLGYVIFQAVASMV